MLESLLASIPINLNHEIILIDDASSDGTKEWLSRLIAPNIKIIFNAQNLGYAKSNNRATKYSRGEFILFINNDLIFPHGWLEPFIECLDNSELNNGIVGNIQYKVIDGKVDHVGIELNLTGQFQHIKTIDLNLKKYQKVFAVTGACFLIRKDLFIKIGGFDERFINGCEDIDLCLRVKQEKYSIYLASKSIIQHHVGVSRGEEKLQNENNSQLLFDIWRPKIKADLIQKWVNLISMNAHIEPSLIDGSLLPNMIARPQIAGRLIAESKLQNQESYWQRTLKEQNPSAALKRQSRRNLLPERMTLSGLKQHYAGNYTFITSQATLTFISPSSVRNIYICGHIATCLNTQSLSLMINVNDIHTKDFVLSPNNNFNVGILYPVLLAKGENTIRFILSSLNIVSAMDAIQVTHFVIDDQIVLPDCA